MRAKRGKDWSPMGLRVPMAAGKRTLLTLGANLTGYGTVRFSVNIVGTEYHLYLQARQKRVRFVFGLEDNFAWVELDRSTLTEVLLEAPEEMGYGIIGFLNQVSKTRGTKTGSPVTRATALAWVGCPDG